jgi:hypothetical protein
VTGERWDIDVDRIVVRGVGVAGLEAGEVRRLVEEALVTRLSDAPTPAGRATRASVVVETNALVTGGPGGIARAVASGVVQAATGRASRG